jgi:hypothetical protein
VPPSPKFVVHRGISETNFESIDSTLFFRDSTLFFRSGTTFPTWRPNVGKFKSVALVPARFVRFAP